jgi:hypothetical protein
MTHIANDYEILLDYLYEEGEPDQRRQIERHLTECKSCADIVRDFQSVRGQLSAWASPTAQLGFKVVQDLPPAEKVAPGKQAWRPPVTRWSAWAQAAAALVLFVSGMAVSQLNVQYGNGGLTVSFGRPSTLREPQGRPEPGRESGRNVTLTPETAPSTAGSAAAISPEETLRQALASADQSRSGLNAAVDSDALLRRVQAMIDRSEQRQQQELALRLAQVVRDVDAQRRADLLRVEQNFGQLEGQTGAAMAQQRDELLNYLVRVSQSQTQP